MEENKNNGNGNGKHIYVMIGMLILVIVGGLIVLSQNMGNFGQYFQGALHVPTTVTTIKSTTNIDLQATVIDLQQKVVELEKFNAAFLDSYKKNNEFTCAALIYSDIPYTTNMTTCQSNITNPLGNL